MKKLLVVMLVLLIPFSVYALDKITDNAMDM
jgi:hypothetical protein